MRLLHAVMVSAFVWLCSMGAGQAVAADFERLLKDGQVPGLSLAILRDGKLAETAALGVRDASSGVPVDAETIFEAASLSKPVFAYAVLQLIDAGLLSLDTPLSQHVPDFVRDDPRAASITVRHVLTQSSGLPNWRSRTLALKTHFPPGERFSYSGEGFVWLQRVVEKITGEPLDAVMTRLVFEPLEMSRSSYVWRADFENDHARPHDARLAPGDKRRPANAQSASTLHTTAGDYARFLQAVLSGARLKPETARRWLAPQSLLRHRCIQCLSSHGAGTDQPVAWGLGWGLEPGEGTFFQWGDNGAFKAFVVGSMKTRSAAVVFTNGVDGMAIMPDVIGQLMPGDHPAFRWLDYPRVSPPSSGGDR
jgi:CubicO group peptidase (beta-lactamase class C family)